MKTMKFAVLALFLASIIFSCAKDDDDSTTPTTTCKILSELMNYGQGTNYAQHIYSNDKLVKINYSETAGSQVHRYDTLMYNTSGQLFKIETHENGSTDVYETKTFTYTNGKITQIVTEGTNWENDQQIPFTQTAVITYTDGKVTAIAVTGGREAMSFRNITYANGNLNTMELDMSGDGSVWLGLEAVLFDTNPNVNNYLVPDWDNILFGAGTNNIKVILTTTSISMGEMTINIGDTIMNNTYTYNTNNMVLTSTSLPTIMQDITTTNTFEWECVTE